MDWGRIEDATLNHKVKIKIKLGNKERIIVGIKSEEAYIGSLRDCTSVQENNAGKDGWIIWTQKRNSNFINLHF